MNNIGELLTIIDELDNEEKELRELINEISKLLYQLTKNVNTQYEEIQDLRERVKILESIVKEISDKLGVLTPY